jgi:hypothetical protein
MRLMLTCVMATRLPRIMVRAAMTAKMGIQCCASAGVAKPWKKTRIKAAKAAAFGPAVINPVTAVGAPS